MTDNGWPEYEKLILYRLNQLDAKVDHLADEHGKLNTTVTKLKAISSMWGAVGGGAIAFLSLLWNMMHPNRN